MVAMLLKKISVYQPNANLVFKQLTAEEREFGVQKMSACRMNNYLMESFFGLLKYKITAAPGLRAAVAGVEVAAKQNNTIERLLLSAANPEQSWQIVIIFLYLYLYCPFVTLVSRI